MSGLGRSILIWSTAAFCSSFLYPFFSSANHAIWQSKIPPDIQGRVFSARRITTEIAGILTMLIAGPMADYIFEPAMFPGGGFERIFGWLAGCGEGSGISLLFIFSGIFGSLTGVAGYLVPVIRNIEKHHDNWQ